MMRRSLTTSGKAASTAAARRNLCSSSNSSSSSSAGSAAAERRSLQATAEALRPIGGGSVTLEAREREAWLRIENAGKKNAFSGKMMAQLRDAVDALGSDEKFKGTTALFVQGTPDFFCSGADLAVLKDSFTREDGLRMSHLMQRTLHDMRSLPMVSVACVNGGAMGGGTELALSCDFRVFGAGATFRMVQTTLGLIPGWGGGSRLVKLVGRRDAIRVLSGAEKLDTAALLELGIADAVAEPGSAAEDAARTLVQPLLAARYPGAVQESKRLIGFVDDNHDMEECLAFEREGFARVWQGEENLDALSRLSARKRASPPASKAQ